MSMMTRQMDIGTLQTCHRVEWRSHGLLHVLSWGRHMEVVDVVNRLTGLSRTSQRSWGNGFWASHVNFWHLCSMECVWKSQQIKWDTEMFL